MFFTIRYPNSYEDIIQEYSEEFNVDSHLVKGVIWAESKFKQRAVSSAGACGLMQLMPATAEWCAGVIGIEYSGDIIFDERINIRLGVFYLSYLLSKFDEPNAIAAYNAGEGNVTIWQKDGLKSPPFKETRDYVGRVFGAKKVYEWKNNFQ